MTYTRTLVLLSILSFSHISYAEDITEQKKLGIVSRLTDTMTVVYTDTSGMGAVDLQSQEVKGLKWNISGEIVDALKGKLTKSNKYIVNKAYDASHYLASGIYTEEVDFDLKLGQHYANKLATSKEVEDLDYLLILSPEVNYFVKGSTSGQGGVLGAILESVLQSVTSEKASQNAIYSSTHGGLKGYVNISYILYDLRLKKILSNKKIQHKVAIPYRSELSEEEKNEAYNFAVGGNANDETKKRLRELIYKSNLTDSDKEKIINLHIGSIYDSGEEDSDHSEVIKYVLVNNKLEVSMIPNDFNNKNSVFDNHFENIQEEVVISLTHSLTKGLEVELVKKEQLRIEREKEAKLNAMFGDSDE